MICKFEREVVLKLKQTNYEVYQLLMAHSEDEKDYCETLDKKKLAKECGLGYFNIEDLFTLQQILEANKKISGLISNDNPASGSTQEIIKDTKLFNKLYERIIPCRVGVPVIFEETNYKHKVLVDFINKNEGKSILIDCNNEESMEIQKILFEHTNVVWTCKNKETEKTITDIKNICFLQISLFSKNKITYSNAFESIYCDFNYFVKTQTIIKA